jgi:hypothetical protein
LLSIYLEIIWPYIFLVYAAYLLPQIVQTAYQGQTLSPYQNRVYILLSVCKSFPLLYLRGCPQNVKEYTPDYTFTAIFVAMLVFTNFFNVLQTILGSKFFIPRFCLPKQHQYIVSVKVNSTNFEKYQ